MNAKAGLRGERSMPKVIYLTGAPASGKSTTARYLANARSDIVVFEYGAELTKLINTKRASGLAQEDLRESSGRVVTEEDIRELDESLIALVQSERSKHIIIDSHPVTKEYYGFRVTPFKWDQLPNLRITEIWVLYAPVETTRKRILSDSAGRPLPTIEEAALHTNLQCSLAATYSVVAGVPSYLFDTTANREELYNTLSRRFDRS
jgi:adenylate kinase